MYHSFLIQSSVDRHLGCFQILAIVNCAAVNIRVYISFLIVFLVAWDIFLKVGLLGQMGVPFLVFWGNFILFSTVAAPVCIPTSSAWGFLFLCIITRIFSFFKSTLLCKIGSFHSVLSTIRMWKEINGKATMCYLRILKRNNWLFLIEKFLYLLNCLVIFFLGSQVQLLSNVCYPKMSCNDIQRKRKNHEFLQLKF